MQQDAVIRFAWSIFWIVTAVTVLVTVVTLAYRWVWSKTDTLVLHGNSKGELPAVYAKEKGKIINPNLQPAAVLDINNPTPPTQDEMKIKDKEQSINAIRALPNGQPAQLPMITQGYSIVDTPPQYLFEDPAKAITSIDGDWSEKNGSNTPGSN